MYKVEQITKDWKEAGSFPAQINLYGFWDEHCFLTKSGDLGSVLKVGGVDYESLDHAGRDYAVKRLEAAFRSLDDRTRLYQILFKRNRPAIPHAEYQNPLVRASVEQRSAFLQSKSDRLYSIEIFWVVMIDSSYAKTGLLHALAQLPKQPRSSLRDLHALFSGNKERVLLYEQIEHDRLRLQQKVQSLSGQLNDLTTVELLGAEKTFRLDRRLVNFRPSKIQDAPLCGARHLDWQICDSELEAHRGYLRVDDDHVRVLTLKELPSETRPLLLQGLFDVPANFHVVTEWHPVDNSKARKEIASRRRHHHNSKTSFVSNLQDRQSTGPHDELVDDSKEAAVAELGSALTALGMEGKNFGEFTLSVVIYDEDRAKVEHAVAEFQKLFTQHDGLLYEERYNLLNAFFATIPGNRQFNLRKQWALNSNYADLSFLFTVDTGAQWNAGALDRDLHYLESKGLLTKDTVNARRDNARDYFKDGMVRVQRIEVVTLTERGRKLIARVGDLEPGQKTYARLVKPREVEHDTQIYGAYRKEAARIEREGGKPTRVELDFELKSKVQSAMYAEHKAQPDRDMDEIKRQVSNCAARQTRQRSVTRSPSPATTPMSVGSVAAPRPAKDRFQPPSSTRSIKSRCSTRMCFLT
jgi:type IV secretion system protein VirB4